MGLEGGLQNCFAALFTAKEMTLTGLISELVDETRGHAMDSPGGADGGLAEVDVMPIVHRRPAPAWAGSA